MYPSSFLETSDRNCWQPNPVDGWICWSLRTTCCHSSQLMHLQELLLAAWSWDPGSGFGMAGPFVFLGEEMETTGGCRSRHRHSGQIHICWQNAFGCPNRSHHGEAFRFSPLDLPGSLTASLPLKIGRAPKGKDSLPTIIFQARAVKPQGCSPKHLLKNSTSETHTGYLFKLSNLNPLLGLFLNREHPRNAFIKSKRD